MNRYLLKVNGEVHCPHGISRPKSGADWEGGTILMPLNGPALARKGPRQDAPAISVGDEVWIWTHEDEKFGLGWGLTAKATAGTQTQGHEFIEMTLENVERLPRPFGLRNLLPSYVDGDTGSRLLDHINHDRWFNVYMIEEEDYPDFASIVEKMSNTLPVDVQVSHAEGWEREVLTHKDALLEGLHNRRTTAQKPRPGQAQFRDLLLKRYNQRCVITNCIVPEALEAAHVMPHTGDAVWDHPDNGLLLRRDLHSLFDSMLWSIDPKSNRARIAEQLKTTSYGKLDGREIKHQVARPLLEVHFRQFRKDGLDD